MFYPILYRYEGKNADLPKLLQSHENEVLVLQTKNKNFRKSLADLTSQLKVRDEELVSARNYIKELTTLVRNRRLEERQALSNQVQDLQNSLKKCQAQVDLLNRKLELESKSSQHKLAAEISKHKRTQTELANAMSEIERVTGVLEVSPYNRGYPRSGRFNYVFRKPIVRPY